MNADNRAGHLAQARAILSTMTREEKIGQLSQIQPSSPDDPVTADRIRAGTTGSLINVADPEEALHWQRIAMEESRLGIPLLIARDVIHGFRTILPIPLGQAATWNPDLIKEGAALAATEARAAGIHWTFAPMLDVCRDPRWGRIAESFGEDPFLTSICGSAAVSGFQNSENPIAACAKHFAGYGACEGGRDYNTTWIPDQALWETHLPPFQAAIRAGVATFMAAFNDLNGVPCSANRHLLHELLRVRMGFDGLVVSDWNSVSELVIHGLATDEREAALLALSSGITIEMNSTCFENHLPALLGSEILDESILNAAVLSVLTTKAAMGLFRNPYPLGQHAGPDQAALSIARRMAHESFVLLKNEREILPLASPCPRIALIGPLANAPREQWGTWALDGRANDSVTPLHALESLAGSGRISLSFSHGLTHSRDLSTRDFPHARQLAESADVIVFVGGEEALLSGEARCRTRLSLPGAQEELILLLSQTGKPIVLVLMNGRPLVLHRILPHVQALLIAWHPGTMAGPALADILLGDAEPSGRLPVSFPRSEGQIPVHYSHRMTGRPGDDSRHISLESIPVGDEQSSLGHTSIYLDELNSPEFAFGQGFGYTTFHYGPVIMDKSQFPSGESMTLRCVITNTGVRKGSTTAQLYLRDVCASITRPVRELKGFRKITLEPGQSTTVEFQLTPEHLSFPGPDGTTRLEAGEFHAWISPDSSSGESAMFHLLPAI